VIAQKILLFPIRGGGSATHLSLPTRTPMWMHEIDLVLLFVDRLDIVWLRIFTAIKPQALLDIHFGSLSPVHTGDYSRRIRRQIVAVSGDYSLLCGQAISCCRFTYMSCFVTVCEFRMI